MGGIYLNTVRYCQIEANELVVGWNEQVKRDREIERERERERGREQGKAMKDITNPSLPKLLPGGRYYSHPINQLHQGA